MIQLPTLEAHADAVYRWPLVCSKAQMLGATTRKCCNWRPSHPTGGAAGHLAHCVAANGLPCVVQYGGAWHAVCGNCCCTTECTVHCPVVWCAVRYGSVKKMLRAACDASGATMVMAKMHFPIRWALGLSSRFLASSTQQQHQQQRYCCRQPVSPAAAAAAAASRSVD
jgi:hypothetical protein